MHEEERNYCCLVLLLTRVGVDRLRQHFIRRWDEAGTFRPWQDQPYNGCDLLTKFKPCSYERVKVKSGDTTQWDLSLLVKVLLHSKPPFVPKTEVKSLKTLKDTRNIVCHSSNGNIKIDDFKKLWSDVCNALTVLGATSGDFKKVKRDVKLPRNELTSLMKKCSKQDDNILCGLQRIQERLQQLEIEQHKMKEGQQQLMVEQQQMKEEIKEGRQELKEELKHVLLSKTKASPRKLSAEEIQQRSEYLKASTTKQTEFQPKLMASHSIQNVKTDDIFINLVMQHGRKSLPKGTSRQEQLSAYSNTSGTPIKRCQDIFISHKKSNPHSKSILVTGKAGIGKSIFCQKLARDWAGGDLFQEQSASDDHGFDFVYLLTFRHLNLICQERSTLRDVLNRCSMLDGQSNIDESLFEHMVEHQDRVLLIIDGYDEFAERSSITSDGIERKYKNDPYVAMPVAALLSKLLKRKIFGEAVVMVTSRPTESDELGGMNFGTLVEIVGFSNENVLEFICKYFMYVDKIESVLNYVMNNEDLLSLAHVPMFCFLMCWCMEWHMEYKANQDLPISITGLYTEFLEMFELKHHSKSTYRSEQIPEQFQCPGVVKSTLEKLSKLAVEMMKQKQFTFETRDLTRFGLVSEEIEDLQESGLLTSGPGLRVSATTIVHYYSFSHLTLHEYLAAYWYVHNKQVPSLGELERTTFFRFFAGLCKREQCRKLMEELFSLLNVKYEPRFNRTYNQLIYEYGDREFGAKMIQLYPRLICGNNGVDRIGNFESQLLLFILNILSYSCEKYSNEQTVGPRPNCFGIKKLDFWVSTEYKRVVDELSNPFCPITTLNSILRSEVSDDELSSFLMSLTSTNITDLTIHEQMHLFIIPGRRLSSIRKALLDSKCKIKTLTFRFWPKLHEAAMEQFIKDIKTRKPHIIIEIQYVEITQLIPLLLS